MLASSRRSSWKGVVLGAAFAPLLASGCAEADPDADLIEQTQQAIETYPNEEPAFNYFIGKGLTPVQSAGIIGNLDVESGMDPTIHQIGGGPGRGLAQWQVGGRWDTTNNDNVLDYATEQGMGSKTLQLQLSFIWYELSEFSGYGLSKLKTKTTVSTAVSSFATTYEGCSSCSMTQRVAHAQSVLDRFGDGTDAGVVESGSSSGGGEEIETCVLDESGDTGICISTSDCDALGDHVSTPGFCPGADDVQCCTSVGGTAGSSSGAAAASSSGVIRGGTSGNAEESGDSSTRGGSSDGDGGCSTRDHGFDASWLVALGAFVAGSRRRRASVTRR